MSKKTSNLNIRMEQHIKEKAQKLAAEKGCTITELIEDYIVTDYAMRSLFNFWEVKEDVDGECTE